MLNNFQNNVWIFWTSTVYITDHLAALNPPVVISNGNIYNIPALYIIYFLFVLHQKKSLLRKLVLAVHPIAYLFIYNYYFLFLNLVVESLSKKSQTRNENNKTSSAFPSSKTLLYTFLLFLIHITVVKFFFNFSFYILFLLLLLFWKEENHFLGIGARHRREITHAAHNGAMMAGGFERKCKIYKKTKTICMLYRKTSRTWKDGFRIYYIYYSRRESKAYIGYVITLERAILFYIGSNNLILARRFLSVDLFHSRLSKICILYNIYVYIVTTLQYINTENSCLYIYVPRVLIFFIILAAHLQFFSCRSRAFHSFAFCKQEVSNLWF